MVPHEAFKTQVEATLCVNLRCHPVYFPRKPCRAAEMTGTKRMAACPYTATSSVPWSICCSHKTESFVGRPKLHAKGSRKGYGALPRETVNHQGRSHQPQTHRTPQSPAPTPHIQPIDPIPQHQITQLATSPDRVQGGPRFESRNGRILAGDARAQKNLYYIKTLETGHPPDLAHGSRGLT